MNNCIQFQKNNVNEQIQEIFKELFEKVYDNAILSVTKVNDTEVIFSSDPKLIPLYFLSVGDAVTAQEYLL